MRRSPAQASHRPSARNAAFSRGGRRETMKAPIVMPEMNVARTAENEYVEEPNTSESSRIQTSSYSIAAAPETKSAARAIAARRGGYGRGAAPAAAPSPGKGAVRRPETSRMPSTAPPTARLTAAAARSVKPRPRRWTR